MPNHRLQKYGLGKGTEPGKGLAQVTHQGEARRRRKRFQRFSKQTLRAILRSQRNEITEHYVYQRLAQISPEGKNKQILNQIANDELKHYQQWKKISGQGISPGKWQIFKYLFYARLLGLTFGVKLMENGEGKAQLAYQALAESAPLADKIRQDEARHEKELLGVIDEEKLKYIGSVVLGLNDALVELTGALAGFTFALQDSRIIAMVGLITGVAASFSMAASEYLATKSEGGVKNPLKAAVYTGIAYLLTVILLIAPFLLIANYFVSLIISLAAAIVIIFVFTFYISVARDKNFRKDFSEMVMISLGVAGLSFGIGYVVRYLLGIEV